MFSVLKHTDLVATMGTLALAGALLVAATAAFAEPADRSVRLTDAQYIHASACAAWAPVAVGEDAALQARVDAESRGRLPGVTSRAESARDNAARQARRAAGNALGRQQLAARFAADCAFLVTPTDTARFAAAN